MSGDVRKVKKDKEIVFELESQIRDINQQFVEQLKSLDHRLEVFLGVVWEMQEYYRRQAEVQTEYSRSLDKMFKQINLRHKDNKQKRESWIGYSTYQAWQGLVSSTKQTSKDQAAVGEIINSLVVGRLVEVGDDMQRIYRKCRDVAFLCQADISKVLSELLNAMKTYHLYHGESQVAENKLLRVQSQKVKVDQQSSGLAKKFVNYEKKSERKQAKYVENKLKALKARNEYLLCIDIANAAIQKYFEEDFPKMVRKMDAGYHLMVSQVLEIHASAQKMTTDREQARVEGLWQRSQSIQGSRDFETFHVSCQKIFALPNKIEYHSHKGDEMTQISAQKPVLDDILGRLDQISMRLKEENEDKQEASVHFESNERQFFDKLRCSSVSLEQYFADDKSSGAKSPTEKPKEDRLKIEDAFVELYRDNLLRDNRIVRLQTKYDSLRRALGENPSESIPFVVRPPSLPPKPKKKISEHKQSGDGARPKLFGGSIEEYVEATGEAIPSIMRSCIRVINIYGMLHQGIFRVSGAVSEMTNYKAMFERGEDPLVDKMDGDDINTVAGLLKLYLRELKEPLFPTNQFDNLIKCSEALYSNDGDKDWKDMLKRITSTFSPERIVIMRYLFAFLSHVTEYSDENMMEAFNLSICFGPTLVIPPADRTDQHQYQSLINDLVKNIIINHGDIFPPPTDKDFDRCAVYEKYFIGDKDFLGSMSDDDGLKCPLNEEDEGSEDNEATVDEDYFAQKDGELSCSKGDVVQLLRRENNDYWTAEIQNKIGLLPDKVLCTSRKSLRSSLRKSHNVNRSTECLMSTDFSQSHRALDKSSSNQCMSENGIHSSSQPIKPSDIKLKSSNLVPANSNAGADGMSSSRPQSEASSQKQQQASPSLSLKRYNQTLVSVLPPLPSEPHMKLSLAAIKKRNASVSSDLDVVVTPPSPEEPSFPMPPSLVHDPLTGKYSSTGVGQSKTAGGAGGKWNSLPHNIPPPGTSSVPVSMPTVPAPPSPMLGGRAASVSQPHHLPQQGVPGYVQSATLPRQSDKQPVAPPIVRVKPALPKKRISIEDRNSASPETVIKSAVPQPATSTNSASTFGRPSKTCDVLNSGSTSVSNLESNNGERNQFSSFKISSNVPKKQ